MRPARHFGPTLLGLGLALVLVGCAAAESRPSDTAAGTDDLARLDGEGGGDAWFSEEVEEAQDAAPAEALPSDLGVVTDVADLSPDSGEPLDGPPLDGALPSELASATFSLG